MDDGKLGGAALLAGAAGTLVTMAFHPTGHELLAPGGLEQGARLAAVVHALAIASLPLTFLGLMALARFADGPWRLALAGLVVYGLGGVAVLDAAIASGFVSPDMIAEMLERGPEARGTFEAILELEAHVNRACARVFVVASSAGIALFSLALWRGGARVLAGYGLVLAAVTTGALLGGHLRLDVHGFGAVALGQAVWSVAAGVMLLRRTTGEARSLS